MNYVIATGRNLRSTSVRTSIVIQAPTTVCLHVTSLHRSRATNAVLRVVNVPDKRNTAGVRCPVGLLALGRK